MVPLILLGFGYRAELVKHTDADYSKYLGPNWRDNKFKGKRVSTLISNHLGFLEILGFMAVLDTPPSFISAEDVSRMPLARSYTEALQCLYVVRLAM